MPNPIPFIQMEDTRGTILNIDQVTHIRVSQSSANIVVHTTGPSSPMVLEYANSDQLERDMAALRTKLFTSPQ